MTIDDLYALVNRVLPPLAVALLATQTSGGALSLEANAAFNHVSIFRIH
jgi:hypothetical protein